MKNIAICVDRTGGDVHGNTNVVQLFRRLRTGRDVQLTHYDPGVGTFSAAGAWTGPAQRTSRFPANAFAAGMRTNHEAYAYPNNHWEPRDRLSAFWFSRGAYCARALGDTLHLTGVMLPCPDDLVRYAVSNYARRKPQWRKEHWRQARQFTSVMSQYIERSPSVSLTYLGVWDPVKAPGILRCSMRWGFTGCLPNVEAGRQALSIDNATGSIHRTASYWRLPGVSRWPVPSTARVHASVQQRMVEQPSHGSNQLPLNAWADAEWRNQPQPAFAAQASRSDG